jgi:hypothetical protein
VKPKKKKKQIHPTHLFRLSHKLGEDFRSVDHLDVPPTLLGRVALQRGGNLAGNQRLAAS